MTASLWLLVTASAVTLGSLFSALVFALQDASRARLEELADQRGSVRHARRASAIMDDLGGHVAAVGLPRTMANLASALAAVMWVAALRGSESPTLVDGAIGLVSAGAAIWAFGLVLPLSIAEHAAERVVLSGAATVRACHMMLLPLRHLVRAQNEIVRRLAGPESRSPNEQLGHDILDAVEEHVDIDDTERDMLEAVVEFRTTTVEQIMTPRTEIDSLAYTDELAEVQRAIDERGHSRIPVYEESLDHVLGFLYAKDLLRWIIQHAGSGTPFSLRSILREAKFVPESKTVRELLAELLAAQVHVAVVTDEYGGTSGLVTMEDIVEEVFGEIADEYEQPEDTAPGVTLDEPAGTAEVDARLRIDDANDALEPIGVELPESEEYDSVGGFVVTRLGRIPPAGESFDHGHTRITVLEAEPTRVVRVRVERAEPAPQPEPEPIAAERGK